MAPMSRLIEPRSMRREAFKLAAQHGAGYACVWMDAPLAVAAARNRGGLVVVGRVNLHIMTAELSISYSLRSEG